ncbi:unnamed protein product [Polarella glacialis]|uniref:Uncharacterized protein n=2 Tax=Polarella glacialis TaxID=89957 RepID=A0A813KQ42_POLGL|nr:unnamed protein product [Polarella glacialis]
MAALQGHLSSLLLAAALFFIVAAAAGSAFAPAEAQVFGIELDEKPEDITARIVRGEMHFEDFYGVALAMSTGEEEAGPLAAVPKGYKEIILAMTSEERTRPSLFQGGGPDVAERITRIARAADFAEATVTVFVTDFGSLQKFFAKIATGGAKKKLAGQLMEESVQSAAVTLNEKTRKERRLLENKSPLLKEAGAKQRAEKRKAARNPEEEGFGDVHIGISNVNNSNHHNQSNNASHDSYHSYHNHDDRNHH